MRDNVRVPLLFAGHAHADVEARVTACLDMVEMGDKAGALPGALTQIDLRKLELARAIAADRDC